MKRKTLLSMATSGLMLAALIPSFAQATDGVAVSYTHLTLPTKA